MRNTCPSFLHCARQANTCTELRACRADAHRQALALQEEHELHQRGAAEREALQVGGGGEGRGGESWGGGEKGTEGTWGRGGEALAEGG